MTEGEGPKGPAGHIIGRNVTASLLARSVEIVLLIVLTPVLVSALGTERYGVLAIGLLLANYIPYLDWGIGTALTTHLAQARGRGDSRAYGEILGASAWIYGGIASLCALLSSLMAGILARHVFDIPGGIQGEAGRVFLLMGLAGAVVLPAGQIQAVLLADHKSYVLNALTLMATGLRYGGLVGTLLAGGGLVGAVALYAAANAVFMLMMILVGLKTAGTEALRPRWHPASFAQLIRFGTGVGIHLVATIVTVNLDKFMLGLFYPVRMIPFYTVPFSLAIRIWEAPRNVLGPVSPALAQVHASGDRDRLRRGYLKVSRLTIFLSAHVCTLLVLLAPDLLRLWVGEEFALNGSAVLRWLALGSFLYVASATPQSLSIAIGRPDVGAKIAAILLVLQLGSLLVLVPRWGLVGAAWAWVLVHLVNAVLSMAWVHRSSGIITLAGYAGNVFPGPILVSLAVAAVTYPLRPLATHLVWLLALMAGSYGIYLIGCFLLVLRDDERLVVYQILRKMRGLSSGGPGPETP